MQPGHLRGAPPQARPGHPYRTDYPGIFCHNNSDLAEMYSCSGDRTRVKACDLTQTQCMVNNQGEEGTPTMVCSGGPDQPCQITCSNG